MKTKEKLNLAPYLFIALTLSVSGVYFNSCAGIPCWHLQTSIFSRDLQQQIPVGWIIFIKMFSDEWFLGSIRIT